MLVFAPQPSPTRLHPASVARHRFAAASRAAGAQRPLLWRPPAPPLPPAAPAAPAPLRRAASSPRAAPADFLAAAESVYEATGVPLVDELMRMSSVEAAVQHSARLAAAVLGAAVVGTLLLRAIDRYCGRHITRPSGDFNVLAAAAAAAFKPGQVLLPYYSGAYVATLGAALAQVAATKMRKQFVTLCGSAARSEQVLSVIKLCTQLVQDTSELVLIVFGAWALIDFKNRVLRWVATNVLLASDSETSAAFTLLRPLNGVLTFAIVLGAGAVALNAYGLHLGPVVASVGGLGVVVGLASQRLLMNAASAIALYSARPFAVGDEVHLMAGASPAVVGKVVQIEPMRTIIHAEDGGLVYVQNADVQNYIIKNMTQGRALQAANAASTTPSEAAEMAAELLE